MLDITIDIAVAGGSKSQQNSDHFLDRIVGKHLSAHITTSLINADDVNDIHRNLLLKDIADALEHMNALLKA
jgi:hypothetical protein